MNQTQIKTLRERIERADRKHRWEADSKPEPANITKAREAIKAFEDAQRVKARAREEKVKAAFREAEEAVLFGDAEEALKAVKKFEGMKFTA